MKKFILVLSILFGFLASSFSATIHCLESSIWSTSDSAEYKNIKDFKVYPNGILVFKTLDGKTIITSCYTIFLDESESLDIHD